MFPHPIDCSLVEKCISLKEAIDLQERILKKELFWKEKSPIILLNQHEQWKLKDPKTVTKTSVPK